MLKSSYNPKAFLIHKKNIKKGLVARTKIVTLLEEYTLNAKTLVENTGMHYTSVLHHLRLLETELVVIRQGKPPYFWKMTGTGQQRLIE